MDLDDIFPSNSMLWLGLGGSFVLFVFANITKEIPWIYLILFFALSVSIRIILGVLAHKKYSETIVPYEQSGFYSRELHGLSRFSQYQEWENEKRKDMNQNYKTPIFTIFSLLSLGLIIIKALFT